MHIRTHKAKAFLRTHLPFLCKGQFYALRETGQGAGGQPYRNFRPIQHFFWDRSKNSPNHNKKEKICEQAAD